jgi:phospholipid-translocating ATPase
MATPTEEPGEISNPVKRIRWATHRAKGPKGDKKRESLLARAVHHRTSSKEKSEPPSKRLSGTETDAGDAKGEEENGSENDESGSDDGGRRIFFNVPLSDDARDEDGIPLAQFPRNKIRTAKYTPISFIPKNLWFQFHTVANIYFLFIIILGVSWRLAFTVGMC